MEPSYFEKAIHHLGKDDTFVALSGIIVSKEEHSFILDDGNGSIPVLSDILEYDEGSYVRVFGRVLFGEGISVQADLVQDLRTIDKKLHKKVLKLLE